MTTIETDLTELRGLLRRMDRLLLKPDVRAAVDVSGNPEYVATGEIIESAWGNAVKDRVRAIFPTRADLDAWTQSPVGTHAYTVDDGHSWVRGLSGWEWDGPQGVIGFVERPTNAGPVQQGETVPIAGMEVTVTVPSGRLLKIEFNCRHVTGGVPGDYGSLSIRNPAGFQYMDGLYVVGAGHPMSGAISSAITIARVIAMNAGTETFGLWVGAAAGAATLSAIAQAPMNLIITDVESQ